MLRPWTLCGQPYQAGTRSLEGGSSGALTRIAGPFAVEALVQAVSDEKMDNRRRAVAGLGTIGDVSAVPVLIEALDHEDGELGLVAASTLGKIGDTSAVPMLFSRRETSDEGVRSWTGRALHYVAVECGTPALTEALSSQDRTIRFWAAKALGQLDGFSALPKLKELAADPDPQVQAASVQAVSRLEEKARQGGEGVTRPSPSKGKEEPRHNIQLAVSPSVGLKVGKPGSLDIKVWNTGDDAVKDVKVSVEGNWQSQVARVGNTAPGDYQFRLLNLVPERSSPKTPISIVLDYIDRAGNPGQMREATFLLVTD